jgi:hypothetical protein
MLIGISGAAQAGKDTIGGVLVKRYGFERLAFADTLRAVSYALDPIVDLFGTRLSTVVDDLGWEQAKLQNPEIRRTLQRFGTEVGRNILGENLWVDTTFALMEPGKDYVITDMRFPNEHFAVNNALGFTVRVFREGSGLSGTAALHASETALDDHSFDYTLSNDGSLMQLEDAVDAMLNDLQKRGQKPPPGYVNVKVPQSDGSTVTFQVAKAPLVSR